jgi:hypothetical protein
LAPRHACAPRHTPPIVTSSCPGGVPAGRC